MPSTHSDLFTTLYSTDEPHTPGKAPVTMDVKALTSKLGGGTVGYDAVVDLLREVNDAQYGIVSSLDDKNQWVRDATQSIPLVDRIKPDSPAIERNNTLLRCLSRLRSIDYAIEKKLGEDESAEIRGELKQKFIKLAEASDTILTNSDLSPEQKQAELNALETAFNTNLIEALHKADMTQGITDQAGAEKLLFHYRNLSSLLIPARTMVTLTYDEVNKVYQRETQVPVTKKTEDQKAEIEHLAEVNPSPLAEDATAHTRHKHAMQNADALFKDLMILDDRALGAQARKTHLVGAKNAFIVKNEMVRGEAGTSFEEAAAADDADVKTLWLARTGSPVFVGKGESADKVQHHTKENLEQIRSTAQTLMGKEKLAIHITTLNTDSPLEKQSTIIDNLYRATRGVEGTEDDISYAPANADGTFRLLDVAPALYGDDAANKPSGSAPMNKAKRLESVSKLMLKASEKPDTLSIVNCASGQDRTGTAVEKATQDWMKREYEDWGMVATADNIESMRARGGNAAEITTHHINGSPGMKYESKAGATFSAETSSALYLKSASTNKSNPVDDVKFLKKPSDAAVLNFIESMKDFKATLERYQTADDSNREKFKDAGQKLYQDISQAVGGDLTVENIKQSVSAKDLSRFTMMASTCEHVIEKPDDVNAAKKLAGLAKSTPDKGSSLLKNIGKGLLIFACAALATVGILAAIPSGGSSLLLTAIGGVGLSAATAATIGGAAVAGTVVAGAASLHAGQDGPVTKSFKDFKSAFKTVSRPETKEDEDDSQDDVDRDDDNPSLEM